jgi:hypothetical protein
MRTLLTISIIFLSLLSCNKKDRVITLVESSGSINDITIVIDNDLWRGEVGDTLREIIAAPVLGLPQEENQFSVTQIPPKIFGRMFKTSRNLLFIGIENNEGFAVKKNIYASPQIAMTIIGKNKISLTERINAHKKEIISVFKNGDLKLSQRRIRKNHWNIDSIKTLHKLGVKLTIPNSYALVDDTGDFLWFRQNISKGSMNIIAYALPLAENDSIINNIVAARDTIGKKYIPGSSEGMYMITEAAYTPFTVQTELSGKPSYETRGKWEVKNDFMAGPFLNYTVVDKANNRLLVVEGFTFAPSIKKRDYMFELEAILKTLKI